MEFPHKIKHFIYPLFELFDVNRFFLTELNSQKVDTKFHFQYELWAFHHMNLDK